MTRKERIVSIGPASLPLRRDWRPATIRLLFFVVLAGVGLYLVKWNPYVHRAFAVAASHSLGASIVSGAAFTAPPPSVQAAIGYSVAYFKAIWQALVLGLLLAATVEAVLPSRWLMNLLGGPGLRSTVLGGVAALPGMM